MFENIKNFADLKKAYHKAARENHPDMGGDLPPDLNAAAGGHKPA